MAAYIDAPTGRVPLSLPSVAALTTPRKDLDLADALARVPAAAQAKAKATATDFEGMFLNTMFSEMTSGVSGEGPFGNTPGTGVWRSMLTEQYAKNFAKAGGVGISNEVFRELILQQAKSVKQPDAKQPSPKQPSAN